MFLEKGRFILSIALNEGYVKSIYESFSWDEAGS